MWTQQQKCRHINSYRATSAAGPFGLIGTLAVTGVSTITFNDNVDANNGPYYYKIRNL
ncbi:MAG: hypothetical protein U0X76_03605 [Bacteroidia bacterium]